MHYRCTIVGNRQPTLSLDNTTPFQYLTSHRHNDASGRGVPRPRVGLRTWPARKFGPLPSDEKSSRVRPTSVGNPEPEQTTRTVHFALGQGGGLLDTGSAVRRGSEVAVSFHKVFEHRRCRSHTTQIRPKSGGTPDAGAHTTRSFSRPAGDIIKHRLFPPPNGNVL